MKAWRIKEPGVIALDELESQSVGESCIKIKMAFSTVSLTDRLIASGKLPAEYPIIPGRQCVGMVVETGEKVKNFVRGDMVAIKSLTSCGFCSKCRDGRYNECDNSLTFGVNEDGFFRDFIVVQAIDAVKLPEKVQPREAVLLDLISIAIETINALKPEKGEHLVIAGAGQLGIILAQVAIYYQIVPIMVDIDDSYLELARSLGVYYLINGSKEDTIKRIFALTGGKMAECAACVSCAAIPFQQILEYVCQSGKVALCGLKLSAREGDTALASLLNKGLTLYGVSEGNKNITSAVNMLNNRSLSLAPLCENEVAFSRLGEELLKESETANEYFKPIVKL